MRHAAAGGARSWHIRHTRVPVHGHIAGRRLVLQAAMAFSVGDVIEVRKHGRATVVEGPSDSPDLQGRYRVQYHEDGTSYWVTPERMRRMVMAQQRIVVAYRTAEYRQAAVHNTNRDDVCLEIGCHAGVTTHMLSKRCKGVIGVDLSHHVVQVAREKFPGIQFEQLDGNDVDTANTLAAAAGHPSGFTKVFIDISGQAPLAALLPLLQRWLEAAPQATLIVKNRALHCLVNAAEKQRHTQQTSSSTLDAGRDLGSTAAASTLPQLASAEVTLSQEQVMGGIDMQQPDELAGARGTQAAQSSLLDEVQALLLGQVDESSLEQCLAVCSQAEVFRDPTGNPHGKSLVPVGDKRLAQATAVLQANPALSQAQNDMGTASVLPSSTAAVLQAAKVAQEAADKAARKQAKAQRRMAKKAAAA